MILINPFRNQLMKVKCYVLIFSTVFTYNSGQCGRHTCSKFGECRNSPSGQCCHCKPGFYGNGVQCVSEGRAVFDGQLWTLHVQCDRWDLLQVFLRGWTGKWAAGCLWETRQFPWKSPTMIFTHTWWWMMGERTWPSAPFLPAWVSLFSPCQLWALSSGGLLLSSSPDSRTALVLLVRLTSRVLYFMLWVFSYSEGNVIDQTDGWSSQ